MTYVFEYRSPSMTNFSPMGTESDMPKNNGEGYDTLKELSENVPFRDTHPDFEYRIREVSEE